MSTDTTQAQVAPPQSAQAADVPNAASDQASDDAFDPERAKATIANLRQFERTARQQARELEQLRQQIKAADDAKLSETEKLARDAQEATRRAEAAEAELRAQRVRAAVLSAATAAGAIYPDLVAEKLAGAVELTESGNPKGLDALVAEARKSYPALFRAVNGSADGGAGAGRAATGSWGEQIRRAVGR